MIYPSLITVLYKASWTVSLYAGDKSEWHREGEKFIWESHLNANSPQEDQVLVQTPPGVWDQEWDSCHSQESQGDSKGICWAASCFWFLASSRADFWVSCCLEVWGTNVPDRDSGLLRVDMTLMRGKTAQDCHTLMQGQARREEFWIWMYLHHVAQI